MDKKDFLLLLETAPVNDESVTIIENKYGQITTETVKKLLSVKNTPLFFDDYRLLTVDEILEAETELHVNFVDECLIPLIDCGENDFIVYDTKNNSWQKFNITEEISFKKRDTFGDML